MRAAPAIPPYPLPPPKPDHSLVSRKPSSPGFQLWFWRWRIWFESTLALSVMEPWEKLAMLFVIFTILLLFIIGVVKYVPHLERRALYYIWGQEGDERLLRQWIHKRAVGFSHE